MYYTEEYLKMLMLLFFVNEHQYIIDCKYVTKILPQVILQKMAHMPAGIAGLMNHNGVLIPVIDLSDLICGKPCPNRFDTRIILLKNPAENKDNLLAFLTERVNEAVYREKSDFIEESFELKKFPFYGGILNLEGNIVQQILADKLFEYIEKQQT